MIGISGPHAGPDFRLSWGVRNSEWMPASNKTDSANNPTSILSTRRWPMRHNKRARVFSGGHAGSFAGFDRVRRLNVLRMTTYPR